MAEDKKTNKKPNLVKDSQSGLFYDKNSKDVYYDEDGKYKSSLPAGHHPSE